MTGDKITLSLIGLIIVALFIGFNSSTFFDSNNFIDDGEKEDEEECSFMFDVSERVGPTMEDGRFHSNILAKCQNREGL